MNKINGVKTDCPHFINAGNVCSRVDGMVRCDEYSECEFKYIDKLKEELAIYKQALEKISDLNLFSLNNSREKIAKINAIICEVLKDAKLGEGEQTELSKYACNLEDKLAKCEQKLQKIKSIVDFNLIFPVNNITKREIGEKIKRIIEGDEDE